MCVCVCVCVMYVYVGRYWLKSNLCNSLNLISEYFSSIFMDTDNPYIKQNKNSC